MRVEITMRLLEKVAHEGLEVHGRDQRSHVPADSWKRNIRRWRRRAYGRIDNGDGRVSCAITSKLRANGATLPSDSGWAPISMKP